MPSLAALVVCLAPGLVAGQAPCPSCQHGNAQGWRAVNPPTTVWQPPTTTIPPSTPGLTAPGTIVSPPVVTDPGPFTTVPGPDPFTPLPAPRGPSLPSFNGPSLTSPGLTGAAYANNPGRIDSNNRLNVFDNFSAIPTTRAWVGYQVADGQRSDVRVVNGYAASDFAALNGGTALLGDNSVQLARFGAEVALTPRFSIAAQGQYVWPGDDNAAQEDWTNPQIVLKHVFIDLSDTVVSGVFGINIEAGSDAFVINDASTRFVPGVLYYHSISPDVFTQGGASFGFASRNDTNTFDWSVGLGWWLFRTAELGRPRYQQFDHCVDSGVYGSSCGGCGSCGACRGGGCCGGWIQGVAPGIYFFGKHALGDNDRLNAYKLTYTDTFGAEVARYEEGRHILDMTLGGTILMKHNLSLNLGYSFPITGARARDNEFLMALNWNY